MSIGLVGLVVAFAQMRAAREFLGNSRVIDGKIIAVRKLVSGGQMTYTPTIQYAVGGMKYTFESSRTRCGRVKRLKGVPRMGSAPYQVGDLVEIRVDRRNPREMSFNLCWEMWAPFVKAFAVGLLFTATGGLVVIL